MSDTFEFLRHTRPFVREDQGTRSLHFNLGALQSMMSCQRPFDLEVPYTKTMMGFLLAKPTPVHILMIGLGGGSLAKFCYRHLPHARITVVEINPHVIALRREFHIPDNDDRLHIVCADGREFVRNARAGFDVVLVDGFDDLGLSTQLCTRTFYEDCSRIMTTAAVLVVNFDKANPAHPLFVDRINQTFNGNSVEIDVIEKDNCIVFAGQGIPISARGMSLSWTLGHHAADAQAQLKTEFQRILQVLDSLEPLGQGTHPPPSRETPSSEKLQLH